MNEVTNTAAEIKDAASRVTSLVISQGIIIAKLINVVEQISNNSRLDLSQMQSLAPAISELQADLRAFDNDVETIFKWLEK